jgi:proteasome alpha subunit
VSPFDWNESIAQREQYIETRLAAGIPVIAVSLPEGILCVTYKRRTRKIYEIYDRILMAGVGIQSDIEAIRTASIEFCHQEGFQRSEDDVTVQRLASAISQPVKKAFSDLRTAPLLARVLYAEVGATPEEDEFVRLGADGDYRELSRFAALAGTFDKEAELQEKLEELSLDSLESARTACLSLVEIQDEDFAPEAALLVRSATSPRRFKLL